MGKRSLIEGEKSVLVIITIFCIAVLEESLRILFRDPAITGSGIIPIIVSVIMLIMIIFIWRETKSFSPIYYEKDGIKRRFGRTISAILPRQTIISIILLILYAIALPVLKFNITTFLFLATSIFVFKGGSLIKSAAISLGVVAAIVVLFSVLFKVILP
ncbi:MAG: hypothetical protein GX301_12220 [Gracilibacteraceae bacterium]|jgi:hypothetical protein|nr:hypothetical protein [Gracilibacteraceae bacterium]